MFASKREKNSASGKWKKLEDLVLPNAKLRFCQEQLQNLNYIFHKKLEPCSADQSLEKSLRLAKSVTERLIQRLLCGAGIADGRFSSKYLISNTYGQNESLSNNLDYLVRLDNLSTPLLYQDDPMPEYGVIENDCDCPNGYARLRLQATTLKEWKEFTNSAGYLRRDKVQARLVELLAYAATQETPNSPLQVDESTLCGIPGKVLDAFTLQEVLKVPPDQHVYYGPGGNVPRFPDIRDFRLAIVDEPNGIKIRVEFISPALANISINVRLLVAIGVDAWPWSSDFPTRVSLGHSDCLILYQAAKTGMYLVGYGVHSSAWQIRVPAAEFRLLNHYGENSTVKTILDILYEIMHDIDSSRGLRKLHSYKIINKYMLFTIVLEELEDSTRTPFKDLLYWSPTYLSTLVLTLLDKLILRLQEEFHSNYFFKKANLLVNPGHLCDDDFTLEANNVKAYMIRLFDESLMSNKGNTEFSNLLLSQESEMVLLYKWKEIVDDLMPPSGTRGRRFCFAGSRNRLDVANSQYTTRQLEYISLLLHNMLKVKQSILQPDQDFGSDSSPKSVYENDSATDDQLLEDIIYILVNVMDQARDQYLLKNINPNNPNANKTNIKIRLSFATYASKLIAHIRKSKELQHAEFDDDLSLVKTVLKWLYKAMDQHKKVLGPILRPYLSNLFATSHAVSCHIDQIKERLSTHELRAMGSFAVLVNSNSITPAQGLLDSVNKEWDWARCMLNMVEKNTLRLVFISGREKVYRHILSLPSYSKVTDFKESILDKSSRTLDNKKKKSAIKRTTTLPPRTYFSSLLNESIKNGNSDIPQHEILKRFNPITKIFERVHRRGQHRGSGDILKSMATMQKLNLFQEAASALSQEDRSGLQEVIQDLSQSKVRRTSAKKWSQTLPRYLNSSKITPVVSKGSETLQRYTPKEESAGIKISSKTHAKPMKNSSAINILEKVKGDSLLGTCRAARLREDNSLFAFQENFKVQALLIRSESFKI